MSRPLASADDELTQKLAPVVRARVISAAFELLGGLLLVLWLPMAEFAILAYLVMIFGVARALATMGAQESLLYFCEAWPLEHRRALMLRTAGILHVSAAVASLAMLALAWISPWLLDEWNPAEIDIVSTSLPKLALVAFIEFPTWAFVGALLGTGRTRQASNYQLVTTALGLLAVLGPAAAGLGPTTIVGCIVAAGIARFVLTATWMGFILPRTGADLPAGSFREQINFSLPLGAASLVAKINKSADKFIVAYFLPAAATAEYVFATYELTFVTAVPMAIGSVLLPRYVATLRERDRAALLGLFRVAARKGAIVVVGAAVFAFALAPDIINTLAGDDYAGAVWPFRIFMLILAHRVAQYGALLQAAGDTKVLLRLAFIAVASSVSLSLALAPFFGTIGVATGTLIAAMIAFVAYLRAVKARFKAPLSSILPWRSIAKIVGASTLSACMVWFLRWHSPLASLPQTTALALALGFYTLVYLSLGRVLGAIRPSDFRAMAAVLGLGKMSVGRGGS